MNLRTARRLSRVLKALPVSLNLWVNQRLRAPLPPARVQREHAVEEVTVAGVRSVWLDKGRAPHGVLVYLHGGGYTAGPVAQQWEWLATVCRRCQLAGLLVDYRLAGDAPYPAAVDDALAVTTALSAGGETAHGRWALSGDSAGGGLAAVICRRLVAHGHTMPAGLVLMSPWVDMRMTHPQIPAAESMDPMLSRRILAPSVRQYAGAHDLGDPELSPVEADLRGFPPVHLSVGTDEVFLPDIRLFQERLVAAGVTVEYLEQPRGIHTYPIILGAPEAQAAVEAQRRFLEQHLPEPQEAAR